MWYMSKETGREEHLCSAIVFMLSCAAVDLYEVIYYISYIICYMLYTNVSIRSFALFGYQGLGTCLSLIVQNH
jgi:hypothetical protein